MPRKPSKKNVILLSTAEIFKISILSPRERFMHRKTAKNKIILLISLKLRNKKIFKFSNFLLVQKEVDAV